MNTRMGKHGEEIESQTMDLPASKLYNARKHEYAGGQTRSRLSRKAFCRARHTMFKYGKDDPTEPRNHITLEHEAE